jgi:hypothetical protein
MIVNRIVRTLGWAALLLIVASAKGQIVSVTLRLDTNRVQVGTATTLHVLAQVVPAQRARTDRIFSWYVDLVNTGGSTAAASYETLSRSASDQDPRTSSSGKPDGANRRGIYDTFLNLAAAGRDTPVELFSVPVAGLAAGHASFAVQAGTGVTGLSADFIVAPLGGGDPLVGGDYSAARVELEVTGGGQLPALSITRTPLSATVQRLTITFPVSTGQDFLEFRNGLNAGSAWQAWPAGPFNSGVVLDTNSLPHRFYRLRISN